MPENRLLNLLLLAVMVSMPIITVSTAQNNIHLDEWTLQKYLEGDIDTLRHIFKSIPETSAMGLFLRGLFEENGEEARFYYDRVMVFHSGSKVEPMAFEKLWQYHYTKGDMDRAKQYFGFLKDRHPEYVKNSPAPKFNINTDFKELVVEIAPTGVETIHKSIPKSKWVVQTGAFSKKSGAEQRAKEMKRFGNSSVSTKIVDGKSLNVVLVGGFVERSDAEDLSRRIERETGIQARVVSLEN